MTDITSMQCPSCGAPVALANRFVKMVVCSYCGATLAVLKNGLDPTGKTAQLADYPTRFAVGKTGTLRGVSFKVLGRVRQETDDAFWDEWYLELSDGSILWLEEEEGMYTITQMTPLTSPVPPFNEIQVGTTLNVNGLNFFVTEKCRAEIIGAEGQLFYKTYVGQQTLFVDGNVNGKLAMIEYGKDEIEFGTGEVINRADVRFDGE